MQVELSKDKIISVHVDDSGESEGIANPVFERLPRDIIDGQTLNVDVISGATVTSQGIIDGIADAITKLVKIQIFYELDQNLLCNGQMKQ